jgi:hypothetical protein
VSLILRAPYPDSAGGGTETTIARNPAYGPGGGSAIAHAIYGILTPTSNITLVGLIDDSQTATWMKMRVFNTSSTLLASSAATAPVSGVFTLRLVTPIALTAGVTYWIGLGRTSPDASGQARGVNTTTAPAYSGFTVSPGIRYRSDDTDGAPAGFLSNYQVVFDLLVLA